MDGCMTDFYADLAVLFFSGEFSPPSIVCKQVAYLAYLAVDPDGEYVSIH